MLRQHLPTALIAVSSFVMLVLGEAQADSACLPDAYRYCENIPIGEGRVLTCLQAHWSDLSGACQYEIQRIQQRSREIDQACTNDVWQFCPNVAAGAGRLRICLVARWDDLSTTCKEMVARVAEKAQALQDKCLDDIDRLCPGLHAGGGQLYLCLKAQESKTSSACRSALR
jgi:hypothetical protein